MYISLIRKYNLSSILNENCNSTRHQIVDKEIIKMIDTGVGKKGSFYKKVRMIETPWDLMSISFDAVIYTNNYRGSKFDLNGKLSLINAYRGYDEELTERELKKVHDDDLMTYILFGHSQEEFWMQQIYMEVPNFNRNYRILRIGLEDEKNIISDAFNSEFNITLNEYTNGICTLFAWGSSSNDFSNGEIIYNTYGRRFNSNIEVINKLIKYYSGDIEFYRNSRFGKNTFYLKPFIKIDDKNIILSGMYYLFKLLSFGAYWVVRNYYFKSKSQLFTNAFGEYYELYFKEVFLYYLNEKIA